jgi:nicotinamidase-related amidase
MAPDESPVVLLLLDVINDLEWDGGDQLQPHAETMAPRLAALLERARAAGVCVVYVNDNYGKWRSDLQQLVAHCLEDDVRGKRLAELLKPTPDDYFVLKPKHSGFYSSALDVLLADLGARTLIITGLAGNICVLYTAYDAHMRNFEIVVPSDCVASNTVEDNDFALRQMSEVLGADTRSSEEITFESGSEEHLDMKTTDRADSGGMGRGDDGD